MTESAGKRNYPECERTSKKNKWQNKRNIQLFKVPERIPETLEEMAAKAFPELLKDINI